MCKFGSIQLWLFLSPPDLGGELKPFVFAPSLVTRDGTGVAGFTHSLQDCSLYANHTFVSRARTQKQVLRHNFDLFPQKEEVRGDQGEIRGMDSDGKGNVECNSSVKQGHHKPFILQKAKMWSDGNALRSDLWRLGLERLLSAFLNRTLKGCSVCRLYFE